MNSMNLPPPFHTQLPASALTIDYPSIKKRLKNKIKAAENELLSSDESEISDNEEEIKLTGTKRPPIVNSELTEPPRKRKKTKNIVKDPITTSSFTSDTVSMYKTTPTKSTQKISIDIHTPSTQEKPIQNTSTQENTDVGTNNWSMSGCKICQSIKALFTDSIINRYFGKIS